MPKAPKPSKRKSSNKSNPIGIVQGHPDGFGFVLLEDQQDVYLDKQQMAQVFPGDKVQVVAGREDRRGRIQGRVLEVLERNTTQLVGTYHLERGLGFVRPESRRVNLDVVVPPDAKADAKSGQIVVVEIVDQPSAFAPPIGKISEVLGDAMAPGMEIEVALRSYDIPHEWPDAVLEEADQFGSKVAAGAKKQRKDLSHLDFVTIDGEDAKDFDDAVYAEPTKGGWKLWVAIADVSHYVKPKSPLDKEAEERGTSVYFPEYVVPMLPEVLSNGLCSLRPKVDRLAMVCEMNITKKGEVEDFEFSEALIRSKERLTYTRVAQVLSEKDSDKQPERRKLKGLADNIDTLYALYQALLKSREKRGALDFDSVEVRFEFDEQRKIKKIVPIKRNEAHRLIEECMLCANISAARFLAKHKVSALYRVHQPPQNERLENLRDFLTHLGLRLSLSEKPEPAQFSSLIESLKDRPDRKLIETQILRAQQQALYQPENEGHFGLAYSEYAHFTSPIRRYPDLLVHRAIRSIIQKQKKLYPYDMSAMQSLGEHCSMAERRAEDASRDVVQWLKCEYLLDHVGDKVHALVTAVTQFGLFAELDGIYVEGLIHITTLPQDYYEYDSMALCLTGKETNRRFTLGDKVLVQVARVSLEERKVDLVLADSGDESDSRSRRMQRKGKDKGKQKPAKRNSRGATKKRNRRK